MNRRYIISALLAGAGSLTTCLAHAADPTKTVRVPLSKFLSFWPTYLEIPQTERTHFRLAYYVIAHEASLSDVRFRLLDKNKTSTFEIAPDGRILTLPGLDVMKRNPDVEITRPDNDKARFSVSLIVMASVVPDRVIDSATLNTAVQQARKGEGRIAGMMAFAVPALDRIHAFGATSGRVILANGQSTTLPRVSKARDVHTNPRSDVVAYVPVDWPQAKSVEFDRVPEYFEIGAKR